jgi:capsular polysaccharide transport system permease protein
MTDIQITRDALEHAYRNKLPTRIFRRLVQLTFVLGLLTTIYWIFFASDRYVSEANLIIRKTDSASMPALDLSGLVSGTGASPVNRADQLLLRDYLLSVDMLKKLDTQLDLRKHFSDSRHDFVSRMWFKNASIEWFYRYYLSRVEVEYDEYAGVLRITVQAYDPKLAHAMAAMLVQNGEQYMNLLGHQMAEAQISFLTNQVEDAQDRFQKASQALLAYQDKESMFSPSDTAQSIGTIVASLQAQRAQLQTQLATLPKSLDPNHPNILLLKQALSAIDRQISEENAKLAKPAGKTLNASVEQFQRLKMQVSLSEDLYKSALLGLERGRADSLRLLEKVSVLQSPTMPEFSMQPRRLYNVIVTLLITLMIAGILKLLESIVLDHVE